MSKLTDQELLEIALNSKEEPAQSENNLSLFISTFGLEEGTLKIPLKLLYRLYKRWSSVQMIEDVFYNELTLLMPNKQEIEGKWCLLLNKSTLKITEDIYKLIKEKKIYKQRSDYFKKHFESFLKYAKVEQGSDWTPVEKLRTIYLSWVKTKYKKNPLGLQNFNAFCKLYFNTRNNPLEVAIKKVHNAPQEEKQK